MTEMLSTASEPEHMATPVEDVKRQCPLDRRPKARKKAGEQAKARLLTGAQPINLNYQLAGPFWQTKETQSQ